MTLRGIALPFALAIAAACAQQPAATPAAPVGAAATASVATTNPAPEVGAKAPDFKFTPVTLAGIGKSTKLSSLKSQTVVVWFFPKARTRG